MAVPTGSPVEELDIWQTMRLASVASPYALYRELRKLLRLTGAGKLIVVAIARDHAAETIPRNSR